MAVIQPDGNYYDKYNSKNPIAAALMKNFFRKMDAVLDEMKMVPDSILEAGCGEGHVIAHVKNRYKNSEKAITSDGFDVSESVIAQAKKDYPDINFTTGSIYEINRGKYDLVIASEVLEHLEEPEKALKQVIDTSNRYIFVSVPNEPIWRILNIVRGSYLRDFGNTPGHIQHWSIRQFEKMLKQQAVK